MGDRQHLHPLAKPRQPLRRSHRPPRRRRRYRSRRRPASAPSRGRPAPPSAPAGSATARRRRRPSSSGRAACRGWCGPRTRPGRCRLPTRLLGLAGDLDDELGPVELQRRQFGHHRLLQARPPPCGAASDSSRGGSVVGAFARRRRPAPARASRSSPASRSARSAAMRVAQRRQIVDRHTDACAPRRAARTAAPRRAPARCGSYSVRPQRRLDSRICAASSDDKRLVERLDHLVEQPGRLRRLALEPAQQAGELRHGELAPVSTSCASSMSAAIFSARIIACALFGERRFPRRAAGRASTVRRPRRAGSRPRAPRASTLARWRGELLLGVAPQPPGLGRSAALRREPAEGVEQVAMGRASTSARSSCWPWISTSARPSWRISVTLDGWSLTKARVRPSRLWTRRRIMSPSASMRVLGKERARRMVARARRRRR